MYVCEKNECTACGACIQICPKNCIDFERDETEMCSAQINRQKCISCKRCETVCPVLNEPMFYNSQKCYAAWSLDDEIRGKSASGGIATELYRFAVQKGMLFAGVFLNEEFEAVYRLEEKNWRKFQNSKYVYSSMGNLYREVKQALLDNQEVVFIGLPCQVAGLRNYLHHLGCSCESLFTVDLICHGVTPSEFLKKHIAHIESSKKQKATEVSFRDPRTYTYTFTLSDKKGIFYQKKVHRNDCYQIAYHYGIAYRNNCYHCKFAREERTGDLTLSDFAGVGSKNACSYDNKNVSCILANTDKGVELIGSLANTGYVFIEERPIEEEYSSEARLHSPTPLPKERKLFLEKYNKRNDFEAAMCLATRSIMVKNEMRYFFRVDTIRSKMSRILPAFVKNKLKKVIRR